MKGIEKSRIVPAATVERAEDAVPLAEALLNGGLDVLEITFRTDAAAEAVRLVARAFPQMLIGAGTLLTADQLKQARDAGAKFGVAPGLNEDMVSLAASAGFLLIPGVATPTETDRGISAGCRLLKFFPAEALGGVKMLKALVAPFAHTGVRFLPTGGIDGLNAKSYLDLPFVAAVGGSWMVAAKLIKERNWGEVTRLSRAAAALATGSSASSVVV